jgi:hypothetical protein
MCEFVDEFLQEIDKIERFYREKCQYYQNEFKTLREAYMKFHYKDQKFQKKGAKLKRINNIRCNHYEEETPNQEDDQAGQLENIKNTI